MRIGDRLEAGATTQVRVHRVSLNWAGANDGDLRHQVVHLYGLGARQRLLLGATLDLKDANGVRGADGTPDLGCLLGECVKVRLGAEVVLNQRQGVGDGGEDAEAEQVELYELQRLDVVLVELQHGAPPITGALHGGELIERLGGGHHAPWVQRAVAGEPIDLGTEAQPATPGTLAAASRKESPPPRCGRKVGTDLRRVARL